MSLDARDYLKWYNDEITRYRNHEWQIAGYSGTFLAFISVLISDDSKIHVFTVLGKRWPIVAAAFVLLFAMFCLFSEIHTHMRLNEYRNARTLLLKSPNTKQPDTFKLARPWRNFISGWKDGIYFVAFFLFILSTSTLALFEIWSRNSPTK
jgi:hypothetical protein